MAKTRFVFRVRDVAASPTEPVFNLVGELFDAQISEKFIHLLIDENLSFSMAASNRNSGSYPITLRMIDASGYSQQQLVDFLTETARIVLVNAYGQQPANLSDWFRLLADSGQFDVDLARAKILYHAFFYFRQLNHEALKPLKDLANQWDELYVREVEAHQSGKSRPDIPAEREKLRAELRVHLETDQAISSVVLDSVRQKVKDYNYSCDSIPFEIFQKRR